MDNDEFERRLTEIEARLEKLEEQMFPFIPLVPPRIEPPQPPELTAEELQAIKLMVSRNRIRR